METNKNMNFFIQHSDIIKVAAVGTGYVTVTLTNIDLMVKILAGLLTCGYMIYKWRKEYLRK